MSIPLPESVPIPQAGLLEALGTGLGRGLETGVQSGLQGLIQGEQQKLKQQATTDLLSSLGFGAPYPTESEVSHEVAMGDIIEQQESQLKKVATNIPLMTRLASENPAMASQIEKMYSNLLTKEKEERKTQFVTPETQKRLGDVFKRQEELMEEGHIGLWTPGILKITPKAREARAEFNTLSSSIEAALLPLVSKGTLAKQRFNYIMSLLPKASDTVAKNKGKIKALKREFKLLESDLKRTTPVIKMRDPSGALRDVNKEDYEDAINAGYKEES